MVDNLISTAAVCRALFARGVLVSESGLRDYAQRGQVPSPRRLGNVRVWWADEVDAIERAVRGIQARVRASAPTDL